MKNVKYFHLKFTISVLQDCRLPKQKTSTLVGAMLGWFKKLYCINRNRSIHCINCDCVNLCLLVYMMGKGFDKNMPIAMQNTVLPRFIINCSDMRTEFKENDILEFDIILFDSLTDIYVQFIYVFETLGRIGLGQVKAKYKLLFVKDENGDVVFNNNLYIKNPSIKNLYIYISSRLHYLSNNPHNICKMSILSPTVLNTKNENETDKRLVFINAESLSHTLKDRLNSLNILQKEDEEKLKELSCDTKIITMINMKLAKTKYYVQEQRECVIIPYFTGYMLLDAERTHSYLEYFLACEKLCIGQNIFLGFGRYIMG